MSRNVYNVRVGISVNVLFLFKYKKQTYRCFDILVVLHVLHNIKCVHSTYFLIGEVGVMKKRGNLFPILKFMKPSQSFNVFYFDNVGIHKIK